MPPPPPAPRCLGRPLPRHNKSGERGKGGGPDAAPTPPVHSLRRLIGPQTGGAVARRKTSTSGWGGGGGGGYDTLGGALGVRGRPQALEAKWTVARERERG